MPFELWSCRWPKGSDEVSLGDPFAQSLSGMKALAAARDHLREQHQGATVLGSARLYPVNVVVDGQIGVLVHDPDYDAAVFIPQMYLTDDTPSSVTPIPVA